MINYTYLVLFVQSFQRSSEMWVNVIALNIEWKAEAQSCYNLAEIIWLISTEAETWVKIFYSLSFELNTSYFCFKSFFSLHCQMHNMDFFSGNFKDDFRMSA